ncbi:rhodanese-like domain-containing protein [Anaerocolumna sedimenticola]|uniref:Rhodanese-like domain-containing protein n=1 Tax=Anaerocolumna sedimenticola TaxID=2696063 RepID=A0A6P1TFJ3_9FIRM|nr:rhodanese-like domain-containing protein [Anaerocolumna sedimenticola]QHQ59914.1 rhodanese-like domain-containing protein [Anaerocolumna sedimenticola]
MTFETIRAKDVENYIGSNNVLIVDLRESNEYNRAHIPSAINIPYMDFENRKNALPFDQLLILYCDRGNLSLLLARELSKDGYQVKNIYGGIRAYRGPLEQNIYGGIPAYRGPFE